MLKIFQGINRPYLPRAASALVLGMTAGYLAFFALRLHGVEDEGLLLYPAERLVNGQIPYRDFFTELAPGGIYIQAVLFKVFGLHFLSARLPLLLLLAIIGWQMFLLGRRILPASIAAVPVLIYVVTAFTRWMVASHHWYSLFFALTATLLLVSHLEAPHRYKLFWAGASVSACGLCMQNKGAFVLLACCVYLFLDWRASSALRPKFRAAPLGWFTAGALAFLAPPVLYFWREGALPDLAYSTFGYLWQRYLPYEAQPLPFLPHNLIAQLSGLVANPSLLQLGKAVSTLQWGVLIPIGSVCYVLVCLRRKMRNPDLGLRHRLLLVYLLFGLALLLSELHRFDFLHSLFAAPILLILAVAFIADRAVTSAKRLNAATVLLILLAVFYSTYGITLALREQRRSVVVHSRRGEFYQTPERAVRMQETVDAIQSRLQPGVPLFLHPYSPLLYFLTATTNPTRMDALFPGLNTTSQFDEVLQLLDSEDAPGFILSSWDQVESALPRLFPNAGPLNGDNPVERYLAYPTSPYKPVLVQEQWTLYGKVGHGVVPANPKRPGRRVATLSPK